MKTSVLLAAASVVALCAGGAAAGGQPNASVSAKWNGFQMPNGAKILYTQTSNSNGEAIYSQNSTSNSSGSGDQGADDFVIPKGQVWTVTEVDVTGLWYDGSGPANSENVVFYKSTGSGEPGNPVKKGAFKGLEGTDSPNFAIKLPGTGLQLKAGHYWVSVAANCSFDDCGEYGWAENGVTHEDSAVWRQEGGAWQQIDADLMFNLRGTSKGK